MLIIDFKGFLIVFGNFRHKVAQTWFYLHETWHKTLFCIYYCVRSVQNLKPQSYARNYVLSCDFKGFLSVFGNFSHKKPQTWCVMHETWHKTLFGVYYCVRSGQN